MKYEVIFFDADDTLFDFKRSEREAFDQTMAEFGLSLSAKEYYEIYNEINLAIWREMEDGSITPRELKIERFRRFSLRSALLFDAEALSKSYIHHLGQASFLFEDSLPLLKELSEDHKLLIITNGLTDVQNRRVRGSVLAEYLTDVIISEEADVSKPDPEIFQLAADRIGCNDKSKMLMVGDSLKTDILGGINFGIDTCWINPSKAENKRGIVPTYEISALPELQGIVL